MRTFPSKISLITAILVAGLASAQLFRTKDRMDNLESFDNQKFSYGFFLAGNNFDYKLVLDPRFGISKQQNLVRTKSSYSFGAGLIGKMRLNENFDLRFEPGLQFVEREIYFDTQSNDQFAAGTPANLPFTPRTLTDADKLRNVKSTYVDLPLLIEIHGDRWYNSRPYAAAGVNWMLNLQSNSDAADDNAQGIFRSTTSNFAWSAEIGIQFYFSRFKLTPGFRGTFMINDEMVPDNAETPPYWTPAIVSAKSRALMFVLKFE
ncbi:PorT protein [Chryseobacterium sp. 6424]|uniref:type IX secretion/gliding motility protein PorT/SprT n=1 Tax=Chryseobacterium sp. 6424 TaxID=2039166 RepID=UPI000EFC9DE9|nr:porin family protein [Chryseobacterium sp. 6424]AYO57250.1 PorT protein [Chryseobacterium sp. 6424]